MRPKGPYHSRGVTPRSATGCVVPAVESPARAMCAQPQPGNRYGKSRFGRVVRGLGKVETTADRLSRVSMRNLRTQGNRETKLNTTLKHQRQGKLRIALNLGKQSFPERKKNHCHEKQIPRSMLPMQEMDTERRGPLREIQGRVESPLRPMRDQKQRIQSSLTKMSTPQRIQRKRVKGWKMPANTKSVTRPGKWGNPWKVGDIDTATGRVITPTHAVNLFEMMMEQSAFPELRKQCRAELRGFNLACYCKPGTPCHADVLLRLANAE